MAEEYNFQYTPLTGRLPGKSFVEQTEKAINELAGIVNEGSAQVEVITNLANTANDNSEEALEKANEALETSGRVYITLPNLDDADDYFDSQLYYFANSNSANLPVEDTGFLEVKTNDTKTAAEQVFVADTTGLMYLRHGNITSTEVGDETVYSVTWETWSSALASETYVQTEVNIGINSAKDYTDMEVEIGVPTGCVQAFAGQTTPTGWLLCDGSAVSRVTYEKLFSVIGTSYGAGDGSTTFNLPNLVDKFIEGSSTAGTVKTAGLPNITTTAPTVNQSPLGLKLNKDDPAEYHGALGIRGSYHSRIQTGGTGEIAMSPLVFSASNSNSIYGNSTTVQPPALTMKYIIKY